MSEECCVCGEEIDGDHLVLEVAAVGKQVPFRSGVTTAYGPPPVVRKRVVSFHQACFSTSECPVIDEDRLALAISEFIGKE